MLHLCTSCIPLFKLEKEALVKGVPVGQAIDIEIPPPRPKRKPNNPYPRKTGACSPNTQLRVNDGKQGPLGSSPTTNLDLEKEPLPERTTDGDGKQSAKENFGRETCSETLSLFKEAPCTLAASTDENSATTAETASKSCKEPVPMEKLAVNTDRYFSPATDEPNRNHKDDKPDTVKIAQNDTGNEMHAAKNFPRHAPVQILDGSIGSSSQAPSSDVSFQESPFHQMGIPGHAALFSYPAPAVSAAVESQNSTSRSNHPPSFHPPFTMFPNIQEYSPYMQISSTFSNLIMSTLLQNPAAHAAASFAASYWPCTNIESSANCSGGSNGFPPRPMNTAPSMAAIAAATVAAATAWWAAHGLLPLCSSLHTGFTSPPPSVTAPLANAAQTQAAGEEREENNFHDPGLQVQNMDQEFSEALQPQHLESKSSETSSSDSGNSLGAKKELVTAANGNDKNVPAMTEQQETNLAKTKKQVDRSSCGSNTPSGSDVETDALEKNDQGNEQLKEPDTCPPANETGNRRNRVAGCINDNWKAVSEGGRLAFQALFSRERLPQSFSPPHNVTGVDKQTKDVEECKQNAMESNEDASKLDLNSNTWESCSCDQGLEKRGLTEDKSTKDGLLTISLQGKLKTRKTGFKPYKRCSVEARESMVNSSQDQGQSCKRVRLDGEGKALT